METKILTNRIDTATGEVLSSVWLTLPTNVDYVKEAAGINADTDELEILESGFAFDLPERMSLSNLNKLVARIDELGFDSPYIKNIKAIVEKWFGSVFECLDGKEEISIYEETTFISLAERFIKRKNGWSYIPPKMREFFDLSAYASSIESTGEFLATDSGIFYKRKGKTKTAE